MHGKAYSEPLPEPRKGDAELADKATDQRRCECWNYVRCFFINRRHIFAQQIGRCCETAVEALRHQTMMKKAMMMRGWFFLEM